MSAPTPTPNPHPSAILRPEVFNFLVAIPISGAKAPHSRDHRVPIKSRQEIKGAAAPKGINFLMGLSSFFSFSPFFFFLVHLSLINAAKHLCTQAHEQNKRTHKHSHSLALTRTHTYAHTHARMHSLALRGAGGDGLRVGPTVNNKVIN